MERGEKKKKKFKKEDFRTREGIFQGKTTLRLHGEKKKSLYAFANT